MSNYRKILLSLLLLIIGGGAYLKLSAAPAAQPVLRLVFGSRDYPVDGLGGVDFPSKGFNRVTFATEQSNRFYVLTSEQNSAEKEPTIQILTFDADSTTKHVVPLRRQDGRLIRHLCYFFSASPTGRHLWIAHRPYESQVDAKEGNTPKAILGVHDQSGKCLQEWVMNQTVEDILLVQAVGESKVYTIDGGGQILVYEVGQKPKEVSLPYLYTTPNALVTQEAQFVGLKASSDGQVKALVAKPNQSSFVFTTFQWFPKGSLPSLFWYDSQLGLFVYQYLENEDGNLRKDKAKTVYRVAPDGTVHKLFETPDVLQSKPGQTVRAGQLLKADAYFAWMEVEYWKDKRMTEYQIVKVPIS